uniref:Uncharacterized protein n=1 Tax=viral metagenome TaxID=1070528 RepID=A0A6C0EEB0_9ZZZZ
MTQNLKSRYDEFIPLFRDYNDYRVRLFLDQLQQSTDDSITLPSNFPRTTTQRYVPNDIYFRWRKPNKNGEFHVNTPEKMKNAYYKYKATELADDDVHPEWFIFFVQMSTCLDTVTYVLNGVDTIIESGVQVPLQTVKQNKSKMFEILKSLKNVSQNSIHEFVRSFLSKIATFDSQDNSVTPPNLRVDLNFDTDAQFLDNIIKIKFKSKEKIMDVLMHKYYPAPPQKFNQEHNNYSNFILIMYRCIFNSKFNFTNPPNNIDYVSSYWKLIPDKSVYQELQNWFNTNPALGFNIGIAEKLYKLINDMNISEFTYNIDKYFISRLLDQELAKPQPIITHFFDDEPPENPKYFRDKDGLIVIKNQNGDFVNADTEAINKLSEGDKCYGTGVVEAVHPDFPTDPNKNLTCTNYFRDCLLGKNIDQCKIYLRQENFWKDAKEEVDAMLPAIAIDTLKAFEFDFFNITVNGKNLKKIQKVEEWLNKQLSNVPNKLTQKEWDAINKNQKLKGYLEYLVKKINDNPVILNPDYQTTQHVPSDGPFHNMLTKMGIKPYHQPNFYPVSVFEKLRLSINNYSNNLVLGLRFPIYPVGRVGVLVGGNALTEHYQNKLTNENLQLSATLKRHYALLIERLKNYNKSIHPDHHSQINKLIEKLNSVEKKLYQTIIYTDKYADLLELLGDNTNNNETLTMDTLKEFVDLRNNTLNKTKKRQLDLVDVLQSIAEQQNQIETKEGKSFPLKDLRIRK